MSKYPMVKLGDVCIVERGGSPRPIDKYMTKNPHGINWIKIGDAPIDSMYITKAAEKIIPEGVSKSRKVKKGDFILSNSMSFGRPYILDIDGCIHDGWLLIRDANGVFEKQFLYYYLSSETVHAKLKQMAVGGVVNNLNSNKVRSLMIPVLRKEEQVKICEKLNKITTIIQYRKQQLIKLDELAKSRFIEMFGDISNNSKNIEISTLGKECIIISGGTPRTGNDEYWDGNIKWITPAEINETERTIYDTERHITETGRRSAHLEIMPKGTVLLSSRAPIGKLAIAGSEMTCNQGFKNLIPNDKLTSIFLYYYLKGIIPEIQSLGRGATFKEISKTIVSDIKILVPPKSKQLAFSSLVEQLDKSKFRMKKCLKLLSYIRHL